MSISQTSEAASGGGAAVLDAVRKVATSFSVILTTLLGLLIITFVVGRMVPADPVIAVIGDQADQATYERVYKEMGLDQPLYVQFATYLGNVAHLNFGQSHVTKNPVASDLARVFRRHWSLRRSQRSSAPASAFRSASSPLFAREHGSIISRVSSGCSGIQRRFSGSAPSSSWSFTPSSGSSPAAADWTSIMKGWSKDRPTPFSSMRSLPANGRFSAMPCCMSQPLP